MYLVCFNAKHAQDSYDYAVKRSEHPTYGFDKAGIKIYACSVGHEYGKRIINRPGAHIWAYIVLEGVPLDHRKESHTWEEVRDGHFIEITPEHLASIAGLKYVDQKLPK